ncbi:hypothetical protein C7H19_16985 [Aphanothece hegewaldii CCALA 016]|uniref:Uncharacterized protein n=1 Tax=Aphanothece hegewaldii CCALA 016 TaxID=2107694 RepID=A0A2T1LUM1_9CHRO|nr:hypothetical protein [Aphanothece hegewaldii]PSF35254.1 hypothetical protein C7H19_16985 [Aphanothece hegewaldii CCALA 016]
MNTIQAIYTRLRKATLEHLEMWLGFTVSGEWLGVFKLGVFNFRLINLEGEGCEDDFKGEININQDNRPNPISARSHTVQLFLAKRLLAKNISGRYRNRLTVPI